MPPKAGAETAVNNQDPARKKRKASRACQSCQRAHLTCSDTRPCARCTKRGEECIEGEKKKARYLYTQEELESLPKPAPKARRSSSSASNAVRLSPQQKASSSNVKLELSTTNAVQAGPAHPQGNVNGSSAPGARATSSLDGQDLWPAPPSSANGKSNGHVESLRTAFNPGSLVATHPQSAQPRMANNNYFASISPSSDSLSSTSLSFQQQQQILQSASQSFVDSYPPSKMSSNAVGSALPTSSTNLPSSINQLGLWPELPDVAHSHVSSSTNASFVDPPFFPSPGVDLRASHTSPPAAFPSHHQQTSERQLPLPILKESLKGKGRELAPLSDLQAEGGRGGYWDQGLEKGLRGAASGSNDAYALATRHGRAYRRLLSHVKDKYGEADALKVVKSISEFRPKVLSTTSHHTQEDTLFLEFALHRALKDLTNTLLPITGTPTAIWRRTGEILAVGAEFCILTEWNQADVVFRDTEDIPLGERGTGSGKDGSEGWKGCFCWELMEKQSVIEFYDNFSRCAFDGTTPSFNLLCTLLTPSGRAISCTACFSIRRDVFDFPSLIVAQFLPLLL